MRMLITESYEAFSLALKPPNGRNLIGSYAKRRKISIRQAYRMCRGEAKDPVKELEEAFEKLIPPELDPSPILEYLCQKFGFMVVEIPVSKKEYGEGLRRLEREMKAQGMLSFARDKK